MAALVARALTPARVWISPVNLPHRGWVLRTSVTNSPTDDGDVDVLMEELAFAVTA